MSAITKSLGAVPLFLKDHDFIRSLKAHPLAEKIRQGPLGRFHPTARQRQGILIGSVVVLSLLGRGIYRFMWFESTDDAFVKAHVHMISARIPGTVQQIVVNENQIVKKGDLLIKLDPRDFEAQVKVAQANFSKSHKDLGRFQGFENLGPTERPVFDQYQANALISEAELTKAQLQYEYTTIVAPEDGKVGKQSVETGEQIQPGQALMALVEKHPWIEANFKENQVSQFRVGQEVEIKIDAIPGKTLSGHVESIAPGSGSTFSLLPPDNATGNFTKIVQRIPVRIAIDPESAAGLVDRLVSGMSSEVTVKTW